MNSNVDSNIDNELSNIFNTEVYDNPLIKEDKLIAGNDPVDNNGDDTENG